MKSYRIELTRKASRELEDAYRYLAAISEEWAVRWHERVWDAISSLRTLPKRFGFAPEEDWYHRGIRELDVGKHPQIYRILYRVEGSTVIIPRIRHGSQDLIRPDSE